jgi:ribosomal protein L24
LEALDNPVKALIKEKKEKDNVLTYLELINLKNVSLLQSKDLKRKTTKVERKKFRRTRRSTREIYNTCKHNWRWHKNRRRV